MINSILHVMSLCGFVLGVVACSVLVFWNKKYLHINRLLSIFLFSMTMGMLVTFLSGWDTSLYAYIYRLPSPLYYLIMPCAYLYVRSVINNETKFRKWDLIHFLPASLRLLEMIPFYFTSYEYRLNLVNKFADDFNNPIKFSEGLLPPYYHVSIMAILGLIYATMIFRLLKKVKAGFKTFPTVCFRTFKWLQVMTILVTIVGVPIIFLGIISRPELGINLLMSTFVACFVSLLLYLFFQPQILYGVPQMQHLGATLSIATETKELTQNDLKEEHFSERSKMEEKKLYPIATSYEGFRLILETYLETHKPFLKKDCSITYLAQETCIPQHRLSALINREYGVRFNEFINRIRIDYIKKNFNEPEWDNLTLEGIARQAGFNSRTTFFTAIKKTTGLSPSEFMDNIKSQKIS